MRAVELKAPKCTEHHGMASDLIEFRIRLGLFLSSSAEGIFRATTNIKSPLTNMC